MGKIAALLMSAGDEVFRQEADVIARRHDAIEDGTGVIDVSQFELLLLMEERNGTMLDPQPPIADCLFEKVVRDFDEVFFDADAERSPSSETSRRSPA